MVEQAYVEVINSLTPVQAALAGTGITGFVSLILHYMNKHFEGRKVYKEIVMKTAIDSYKAHMELAIELSKQGKPYSIMPFEAYVISNSILFDRLNHATLTKNTVSDILKDVSEITNTIDKHYEDQYIESKGVKTPK